MAATKVTEANFDEVIGKSEVPVLVDFWASWCGPCRMLSPIVEELSEEADGFAVASIDCDEEEELAARFGISSIPCLIVFEKGEEVRRSVGVIPKEKILSLIKG